MIAAVSMPMVLDVIIAVLLVATIVYAAVLNRKLAALRNAKAEMEMLAARFADSTAKAESGIQNLKAHASESGVTLDSISARAAGLAGDLSFLVEKGTSLANRLEEAIDSARGKGPGADGMRPLRAERMTGAGTRTGAGPGQAMTPAAAEVSPEQAALFKSLRGVR
jgi:hypothetical protein